MCSSMSSGLTCGDLTCGGLICRTTSQAKPPTTNSTNKYPNVKQLSWAINYVGIGLVKEKIGYFKQKQDDEHTTLFVCFKV